MNARADTQTLSEQLLRAYFDIAGVCTTSQVIDLRDEGDSVTIEIDIEPNTQKGLASMHKADRDDWFSLHCPPQIHGVWRQAEPPSDILVTGLIGDEDYYTLSCVTYQRDQWTVRESSLRDRIQRWLEERLDD